MKAIVLAGLASLVLAAPAWAQSGIEVRSIRVLAVDVEATATFYKTAFGMSETRRPVESAAFTEIVINTGEGLVYAMVADPEGNPIELLLRQ